MTQILNNQFRANPFGFASTRPIFPGDPNGTGALTMATPLAHAVAGYRTKPGAAGRDLHQVTGENRIWAGDLNQVGEKYVLTRAPGVVNAPSMAIYWLTWAEQQVVRTVLRRTRAQHLRGGKAAIAANPANAAAVPPQNTNDPDIFFTAGVNGCMVIVEGSREEPVVYHCNAKSEGDSPAQKAIQDRDAAAANLAITNRADLMGGRYTQMSGAHPKAPKGAHPTLVAADAVDQSDYMIIADGGMVGAGYDAQVAAVRQQIALARGMKNKKLGMKIRVQKSQGTVFGARSPAGLWTFYYQKLVCWEEFRDTAPFYKTAVWTKQPGEHWYVIDCREFWPTGRGHASI